MPAWAKVLGSLEPDVGELQATLVVAVGAVEEQPPVAGLHVERLQQLEIGRELHQPLRVPRCLADIDDGSLRLAGGVYREARPAGDPLVGASCSEGLALGEGRTLDHRQLHAIGHGLTAPSSPCYLQPSGNATVPVRADVAEAGEMGMIGHGGHDTHSCARALEAIKVAR